MCSDAPNILFEERKLWSFLTPADPKATQLSFAKPWQFLTIGPESEWHQATAYIGNRRYPFSVRSPLMLPPTSCKGSTTIVRPHRRANAFGTAVIGPQPRDWSPETTTLSVAGVDPALAYLHVVAYDQLPPTWAYARPDAEYLRGVNLTSVEQKVFACPVMGRRRLSVHFDPIGEGVMSYAFDGLTAFDDSLRSDRLLSATFDTATASPAGNGFSRHLDIDTDAYDWIQLVMSCTVASSVQVLFWTRD